MTRDPYGSVIKNFRNKRKEKFRKMEGYVFGVVLYFDNNKGMGMAEDMEGNKYLLHYKNMDRINYKILSKDQKIHFKPGLFKQSVIATDVAIVY